VARWAGWLAEAFTDADDRDQPLGRLSRRLMQTIQTPMPGQAGGSSLGYGLGLMVQDTERHGLIVSHSGGYPGYGAHLRWHPVSGIGVVAFENATYSAPVVPVTAACQLILDETIIPDREPVLWPETAAARLAVERLLRHWDDQVAAELFAENVDADEPLDRRRIRIAELAADISLDENPRPLIDCSPISRTPAQLAWTVPGRTGSLRCEISLTPEQRPRVQTLTVRRG
jgi:CubicO group peptidase (beta-lactamase class C family)